MTGRNGLIPLLRAVLLCAGYLAGGLAGTAAIGHPGLVRARGGLIPILRGEGHNPYARRVLSPALVRGIHALLPAAVREGVERRARGTFGASSPSDSSDREAPLRARGMEGNWDYALAAAILNVLSVTGCLFVLRALLGLLFRAPPLLADAFPLLAVPGILIVGQFETLFYDYPQVFLFTLGLYLIASRREIAYAVLLPLSVLNKETSVLLPVVYAATRAGRTDPGRVARSVALQLAVCGVVLGATVVACRNHPGALVENHMVANLQSIAEPGGYFRFESVPRSPLLPGGARVPVPVGWNLPALLVLALLVVPGWRPAPTFLRRALPCVLVPLVGFSVPFGMWSELRAYHEAVPLVLLLVYSGVRAIWGIESRPD